MPINACDSAQFVAWVQPHWPAMYRLALRLVGPDLCEDVLQEALMLAWRKRGSYDPDRGTPQTWLLVLVADRARKQRRVRREANVSPPYAEIGSPESRETRLDIERALEKLSARQRVAVELHYFLDLPIDEMASVMKCSEGTVKSTLFTARSKLARLLREIS